MSRAAFLKLQNSVVKGVDFPASDLKPALLFEPESPESFSTFTRALVKGKIDPTELFVNAALLAVEINNIYIRYAGLGLRFGANANSYYMSRFDFDGNIVQIPVHIAKRIYDATPRSREESLALDLAALGDVDENQTNEQVEARLQEKQRASLDVLCLMAIQGMVSDAKITTAALLTQSNINATRFANERPEFFSSVYGDIKNSGDMGLIFADEIKYFEEWKKSLQNAYGSNPERSERIFKYALLLDIQEVLTLTEVYATLENVRLMFFFQDTASITELLPRLRELKLIGVREADYSVDDDGNQVADDITAQRRELELILFDWCIAYYNLDALRLILKMGIVPDYSFRSETIRAGKAVCGSYSVQCQVLNTMIVEMVKMGYGLDTAQLQELAYSPSTLAAVRKEYAVPAWQYMCKIRTGDIDPYMKEMSREAGIPVGLNKDQTCYSLEAMSRSNPSALKAASYEVNRRQISLATISPADVASGRKALVDPRVLPTSLTNPENSAESVADLSLKTVKKTPAGAPKPAPICANADTLFRPIEDYPALDRVTYSDGRQTWCFTSENYQDLLDSGINRWATGPNGEMGEPVPQEVLIEIQQKLNAIQQGGYSETPGSVSQGIDKVFEANPATTEAIYEMETAKMLRNFYELTDDYGIDRDVFASLSSADYQNLADSILSSQTRVVVDQSSPIMALRDFASATLTEAKNFKNRDQIGSTLASILGGSQPQ
jgi:hypothetical protein